MFHSPFIGHLQEMEQILEHIHANRADTNAQSDDFDQHKLQQSGEDGGDPPDSEAEGEADLSQASKQKRLQIMVFSATLTLPLHLRKRLNKSKPVYSTCVLLLLAVTDKLLLRRSSKSKWC